MFLFITWDKRGGDLLLVLPYGADIWRSDVGTIICLSMYTIGTSMSQSWTIFLFITWDKRGGDLLLALPYGGDIWRSDVGTIMSGVTVRFTEVIMEVAEKKKPLMIFKIRILKSLVEEIGHC